MSLSQSAQHKMCVPADSAAAGRPRVLVIQLGSELECAMTRGWIAALQNTADIDIVAQTEYLGILDVLPNPVSYHPLSRNPLDLVRMRHNLKALDFDRALCLNNTLASRLLGTVCIAGRRIQTQIGPPTLPSEIDAVLAVLFGRLGVEAPDRSQALTLSSETQKAADNMLNRFGFSHGECPPIFAPRAASETALSANWRTAQAAIGGELPVILLPTGQEIEFIGTLVGKAFFVPAPELALRAALIQRARMLFSNDTPSIELAGLTQTPVFELRGDTV